MIIMPYFSVTLLMCNFSLILGQSLIVHLDEGTIQGTQEKTEGKGITYRAFRGIPYAAPPLGDLRFRPPQPPTKWDGILNASKDGPQCIETDVSGKILGQEDCLTINVYTPSTTVNGNLPTMVWIYGGGFIGGNSSYARFAPDYLLDNNVCFVSFNYRLGIFGFISTDDSAALGNFGLKDQKFALQWVQKYIETFGCDKNNVLLFGESAGAASVSILSQSKTTEGLFHKAIMQSGSSLCMWARVRQPRQQAFKIGNSLNVYTDNSTVLIEKLRRKTYEELQKAAVAYLLTTILTDPINQLVGFGPVIEPQSPDAIITQQSYNNLQNGGFREIPTIMGFNSNEGTALDILPISLLVGAYSFQYGNFFNNIVPVDMNIRNLISGAIVAIRLTDKYFGKIRLLNFQTLPNFVQYISDSMFIKPIVKASQLQANASNVFLYQFSFEDPWGTDLKRSIKGVGHADEISYIFKQQKNFQISNNAKKIRSLMCKMWTNMAYTGNPTIGPSNTFINVTWPTTKPDNVQLLDIDRTCTLIGRPHGSMLRFWDDLYNTYGVQTFDTY